MDKFRVVSVCWVDVYASDVFEARKIAGDIYYNMTPEEQDSLPGLALVSEFGKDEVHFDRDDAPGWDVWSPSNDPF